MSFNAKLYFPQIKTLIISQISQVYCWNDLLSEYIRVGLRVHLPEL